MSLSVLPYHRAVVDHLRAELPSAWAHYTSDTFRDTQEEAMRLHLLQTTVALSREAHPELYAMADEVAAALDIGVPVELFQAPDEGVLNAALLFAPRVARVVLHGAIQERLAPDELRCVLGHELAHHLLWSVEDGRFLHARRLLEGLASHTEAPSILETLRLYQLCTEIYADRGGLAVTELDTAIRTLVRIRTGLATVAAADFLAQSHELLDKQGGGSREWTHPEAHIRALVLERVAVGDDEPAEDWIRHVVEGPIALDALDLLRRAELDRHTRQLVAWLLEPPWFRSDAVMGHTRQLFDDEPLPEPTPLPPDALAPYGDTVLDYLSSILLDFVAVDPGLDELPLLRADQVAEALGLQTPFQRAVNRHLKRTRKAIAASLVDRDSQLLAAAETRPEEGPDAG